MATSTFLRLAPAGLYCEAGDFYVDPWQPVERAVITHAHSDHAHPGCGRYLTATPGMHVLRARLGASASIEAVDYGRAVRIGGVRVSLHPAGHILGSAQVRLEHHGEVVVVSGDYQLASNATCDAFEPVRCHIFVTESTFGLPIYRWPPQVDVVDEIHRWWRANQSAGKTSVLFAYALGKAQRVLTGLDQSLGPIYVHGAVDQVNRYYALAGVALPPTIYVGDVSKAKGVDWSRGLVVAPTSAQGTPWLRRFGEISTAFASGWMRVRGLRRRQSVDRGFVLSDHADWPGLLEAIAATGADHVWVTHGYTAVLARWLQEHGRDSLALDTQFGDAASDDAELATPET